MRRGIAAIALLAGLLPGLAAAQVPQTLPSNTVVGRTGIGPGPAQAIPFVTLKAILETTNNNVIDLDRGYGVKGDNLTDNSAAIQQAITDSNVAGGNRVLQFPTGTILAPTLATNITANNTWFSCVGEPGNCILQTNINGAITWSANYGGTYNLGFDNGLSISAATWSAGVLTLTTRFAHGIGVGVTVQTIDAYNSLGNATFTGTFVTAAGTTGSTIVVPLVADPGTFGTFTGIIPKVVTAAQSTNTTFAIAAGLDTQFINPFLRNGIGVFLATNTTNVGTTTVTGAYGGVNCLAAAPLFVQNAGNGLTIRHSNVFANCVPAVAGRGFFAANAAVSTDTTIIQNNLIQKFDYPFYFAAPNGISRTDIYLSGNVTDSNNNGMLLSATGTGFIAGVYFDDPWLSVTGNNSFTNGYCMVLTGTGSILSVHVTARFPTCATGGILGSVTGTAQWWDFSNVSLDGGNALNDANATGIYLNSTGTGTWANISVVNSRFRQGASSTHILSVGCRLGGIIDHLIFSNNDCEGTTNYNGMLAGTGTTFAHTSAKQRGNIALQDAPVYASTEGGTGAALPVTPASVTAPTIASGFCTSPSIPANNGTLAFTIGVGTACGASTGTLTMPSATTGWICDFHNVTAPATNIVEQTGGSQTTVTLTNYVRTTGVAGNFTDSNVIRATCVAY